jgi:hypothetical protein
MNDTPSKPVDPTNAVQGEGDYESARKYNKQARAFAESGKVEQAAEAAAPRTQQEQDELLRAEAEGRSHAKGQAGAAKDAAAQARVPESGKQHPEGQNPEPEKRPGR